MKDVLDPRDGRELITRLLAVSMKVDCQLLHIRTHPSYSDSPNSDPFAFIVSSITFLFLSQY